MNLSTNRVFSRKRKKFTSNLVLSRGKSYWKGKVVPFKRAVKNTEKEFTFYDLWEAMIGLKDL